MPKASSFCVKVTDCGKLNTSGSHGLTALEADGLGISSLSDSDDTDLHMLSESRQVREESLWVKFNNQAEALGAGDRAGMYSYTGHWSFGRFIHQINPFYHENTEH
jgi:hypothetical protein